MGVDYKSAMTRDSKTIRATRILHVSASSAKAKSCTQREVVVGERGCASTDEQIEVGKVEGAQSGASLSRRGQHAKQQRTRTGVTLGQQLPTTTSHQILEQVRFSSLYHIVTTKKTYCTCLIP